MIYITGDCHQNYERFNTRNFPEQKEMTKDDYVIICGDFGGASSHDIEGGILELDDPNYRRKKRELDFNWISYRINHLSWWKEELPSEEEMEEGRKNLEANGNQVDFIISHCCASSTQVLLDCIFYKPDYLTAYFEEIRQKVEFKKWFCGHYHEDRNITNKEIVLYEQIIRVC